jgi:hypothetical protein
MGIGVYIQAPVRPAGHTGKPPGRDILFRRVIQAFQDATRDDLLGKMISYQQVQHRLYVSLHPAAETIELVWHPSGTLAVSVKTSSAGPGFHAHLVDLLEAAGREIGLDWDWRDPEGGDESSYAILRDFGDLQDQMAGFCRDLGQMVSDFRRQRPKHLSLNMPVGFGRVECPEVVTPLGPVAWDWFEETRDSTGRELARRCRTFLPWWSRRPDAEFWRKTGMAIAWTQLPYRRPVFPEERQAYELVQGCFRRARQIDPDVSIDEELWTEIADLVDVPAGSDGQWQPPRAGRVGYLRTDLHRPATGLWTVRLPGYYPWRYEDVGGEVVFWFDQRTIRLSSLEVKTAQRAESVSRSLLDQLSQDGADDGRRIEFSHGAVTGQGWIRPTRQGDAESFILQGTVVAPESVAIVTISSGRPEDAAWAEQTFTRIDHPAPHSVRTGQAIGSETDQK